MISANQKRAALTDHQQLFTSLRDSVKEELTLFSTFLAGDGAQVGQAMKSLETAQPDLVENLGPLMTGMTRLLGLTRVSLAINL